MRSFLRTNYAVRLNKGIERKLIFQSLADMRRGLPFESYRYIGMGAMWFVDFLMADRYLKIRKMVSFEKERADAERARTNVPLSCIDVVSGDLTERMKKLPISQDRAICWLDFDNSVDDEILEVVRDTVARMRSGSVLIVTVAARKPSASGQEGNRERQLRELFLDAVPPTLAPKYFDTDDLSNYPSHLVELLHETMREAARTASGGKKYQPLFSYAYRDGQAISTAGGIVGTKAEIARLENADVLKQGTAGSSVTVLAAPLLTAREKAALDSLLPTRSVSVRRARRVDVRLTRADLDSYTKWFRQYPWFAEVELR
jgi:hypothetical protein